MRVPRLVLVAAVPLALAALLGSAGPAGAIGRNSLSQNGLHFNGIAPNSITFNALNTNSLTQNALAPAGTSLDQLDGVQVEAVTLPDAAE